MLYHVTINLIVLLKNSIAHYISHVYSLQVAMLPSDIVERSHSYPRGRSEFAEKRSHPRRPYVRFHGQHSLNKLHPTVVSKSLLVYKTGFMAKKILQQHLMTNTESLLEATYPPLKANNKQKVVYLHEHFNSVPSI